MVKRFFSFTKSSTRKVKNKKTGVTKVVRVRSHMNKINRKPRKPS